MVAGPVTAVLDALSQGAGSLAEVRKRTGLRADVVRAAAELLVLQGRLQECTLAVGCPPNACGSCALTGCGERR